MSSSEPIDNECSADGLLRGGKGEISVSLVSWANVSFRRRRLRLLFGVVRERRDTAFFIAGLSFWSAERKKKAHGKHKATYVKTKEKVMNISCKLWNEWEVQKGQYGSSTLNLISHFYVACGKVHWDFTVRHGHFLEVVTVFWHNCRFLDIVRKSKMKHWLSCRAAMVFKCSNNYLFICLFYSFS